MRIVAIRETHGQHEKLGTLRGDVLIHCGDVDLLGAAPGALGAIDDRFGRQHSERILCIGGNHDAELQRKVRIRGGPFGTPLGCTSVPSAIATRRSTARHGCQC